MSTSGLTNQYNPPTLDGLTIIEADELYVGGQNVDVSALVPYTGATQTLDMGSQNIKTTHAPVDGADVVNLDTLTNAITFVDNSVALTYLSKIALNAQNVAGRVQFQDGIRLDDATAGTWTITTQYVDAYTTNLVFTNSTGPTIRFTGDNAFIKSSGWSPQRVPVINSAGELTTSSITDTELSYLSGTSSNIQTQLNGKLSTSGGTITGALTVDGSLSVGSRLLGQVDNNPSGNFWIGLRGSGTELQRLAISIVGADGTGTVSSVSVAKPFYLTDPTPGRVLGIDSQGKVFSTIATITEIGYLSGVNNSIQTQLDSKANTSALASYVLKAGDTMTGNLLVNARIGVNQSTPQWKIHASNTNAWSAGGYTKADGIMALGGKDNNPDYQYLIFPNPSQTDGGVAGMNWWSSDMITGRYKNEYRLAWWKETHAGGLGSAYKEGISLYLTDSGGYTDLDYIKLNGKTDITGRVSIELTSNKTPNLRFYNTNNHISNTSSEAYLFTGYSGHITIGRNLTRDADTTNLMLGVASTEEAQIISRNTDDSEYMPLSFASSKYVFTGGDVGIGTDTPGYLFDVNGAGRVRGSFHVGVEGDATSQIFFGGPSGDTGYNHTVIQCRKYSEAGEGSELVIFKGNDIRDGYLLPDRVRLRGANICFDTYPTYSTDQTAENIRMTITQNGYVGINTASPLCSLYNSKPQDGSAWVGMSYFGGDTTGIVAGSYNNEAYLGGHNGALSAWTNINLCPGGVCGVGGINGSYKLNVEGATRVSGFLTNVGGSKIVVQDSVDGGPDRGIFLWNAGDSNWGIYMAQAGYGRSLSAVNPVACAGWGFQQHAMRFRVGGPNTVQGFIFEGSDNNLIASIRSDGLAYFSNNTRITGRVSIGESSDSFHSQLNIRNPSGQYTHLGSDDYGTCNYIRGRTIVNSGYFEIGDSYVWRAPLDITTTVGRDNGCVRYFDYWGGLGFTCSWYSYSAMADTWGGARFMAYSDIRKKKNIQTVVNALQALDDIRIVSYEHIDVAQPPNYWGVIAQEVEGKYPHLITTGKEFLPNIYKNAVAHHCTDCGCFVWLEMEEEQDVAMVGKAIRIYTYDEDEKKEYEEHTDVVKVEGKRIKVKKWKKGEEERYVATERVFVYGTCEEDVRTVDKTQFGLLAVSACQELKHQTETQKGMIEALSSRIGVLEAREVMWEQHARQQEATIKGQEERLKKAEANLEKVASLLAQIISK